MATSRLRTGKSTDWEGSPIIVARKISVSVCLLSGARRGFFTLIFALDVGEGGLDGVGMGVDGEVVDVPA